ncbi:hypothetical protein [Streptacidiphilus sp. P02-A3a]|nr:hypothetical protein [Streptacidiphilus sp. P02-A3a]QMU69310.1 hypothetical protein GXP74_14710 [Streptacidiphilus sp. P02-A3a]
MFDVIEAGDERAAAELMRLHVASTRAAALAVLSAQEPGEPPR